MCDTELHTRPRISAMTFTYPHLFVGTDRGDLIAFRIYKRTNVKKIKAGDGGRNSWDYKVLTAEHCSSSAVLDIFATPLRTEDDGCQSLFRSMAATPTSMQVLVVCVTTPTPSPLTSPMQLSSRAPSGGDHRCSSVASNGSASSASTFQRRRIGTFDGSLPKLSFYSASPSAHTLLPLRSS